MPEMIPGLSSPPPAPAGAGMMPPGMSPSGPLAMLAQSIGQRQPQQDGQLIEQAVALLRRVQDPRLQALLVGPAIRLLLQGSEQETTADTDPGQPPSGGPVPMPGRPFTAPGRG